MAPVAEPCHQDQVNKNSGTLDAGLRRGRVSRRRVSLRLTAVDIRLVQVSDLFGPLCGHQVAAGQRDDGMHVISGGVWVWLGNVMNGVEVVAMCGASAMERWDGRYPSC